MSKDEHYREMMVETIMFQRGEPADYVAPGADQKWRARNLLDIHWPLTGIDTPSASHNRIMSCIIDHANPHNGACYPRQETIAIETGYSLATVKRAIVWWKAQGFLKTEDRGLAHALAYHPQWKLFELHWVAVSDDINAQKETLQAAVGHPECTTRGSSRVSYDEVHHGELQNLKEGISKEESHPKGVPPYGDTSVEGRKRKEGIQGERAGKARTPQQAPPGGPSCDEARNVVLGYCGGFEKEHLPNADFEAAISAEMEAPGSGREVVRAAATKAWKQKRQGGITK